MQDDGGKEKKKRRMQRMTFRNHTICKCDLVGKNMKGMERTFLLIAQALRNLIHEFKGESLIKVLMSLDHESRDAPCLQLVFSFYLSFFLSLSLSVCLSHEFFFIVLKYCQKSSFSLSAPLHPLFPQSIPQGTIHTLLVFCINQ